MIDADPTKPQHRQFYNSDFPDERLDYQEGWCFQRLGYPAVAVTLRSAAYCCGIIDAARDEEARR